MQCRPVAKLPEGLDWQYEVKFDGYRALGIKSAGRVALMSRNEKDFSSRFPSIAKALERLPDEAIVDGELVAFDANGRPSFNLLQNYQSPEAVLGYYVFDLPHVAGKNLQGRPLSERRELLRTTVMPRLGSAVRLSESFDGPSDRVVKAVSAQGLEGVIGKRRESLYEPGRRSGAWVKMRVNQGQELVIGGYVPAEHNFDSIIVGYYSGGHLIYVARVRNGFVPEVRAAVFKRFRGLETGDCPFANLPQKDKGRWGYGLTAEKMKECRWLKPELVAQIEYATWTEGDHLRHSKFIGLRDDKDPCGVCGRLYQAPEKDFRRLDGMST
jgi:DNA ligase D-like protein (predicted ligase)